MWTTCLKTINYWISCFHGNSLILTVTLPTAQIKISESLISPPWELSGLQSCYTWQPKGLVSIFLPILNGLMAQIRNPLWILTGISFVLNDLIATVCRDFVKACSWWLSISHYQVRLRMHHPSGVYHLKSPVRAAGRTPPMSQPSGFSPY